MITKEMTMAEVLKVNPKKAEILKGFGLKCVECRSAQIETVAEAAIVHGINLEDLLKALNKNEI